MAIPKKPSKDVEDFIRTAKVEERIERQEQPKVKKFLIELPYELWLELKMEALKQGKPLKTVILEILSAYLKESRQA